MADFIHSDQVSITIVTNKITSSLNLQTIKKYIKNANYIEADEVKVSYLPQFKSYLKIIGVPYLVENTNTPIIADSVEVVIKSNQIFNNIIIVSKLCIIKVSPKSDMIII